MDHCRHYDRLAPRFTQHWSYSPEFVAWMTGCLATRLRLHTDDRLVDAGCGTGIYATRLAGLVRQVVCLDPSAAMLEHIPDDPRLVRIAGTPSSSRRSSTTSTTAQPPSTAWHNA